jgi:hypothetical protein
MTKLLISEAPPTESQSAVTPFGQEVGQRECHEVRRVPWYAVTLCRLGIHSGKWVYVTDGNCSQLKVCGRCGKTRVRTKHQREWRYIEDRNCDQVRNCKRCGEATRHRVKHIWDPWYEAGPDTRERDCSRCGKQETYHPSAYD